MANWSGRKAVVTKAAVGTKLAAALVSIGVSSIWMASAIAATGDRATIQDNKPYKTGVYRSVLKDGSVVFSDRPLEATKSMTVMQYGTASDPAEVARRERDYWRQRSEAFAERSRAREKELEETKRAVLVADKKAAESGVVVIAAGGNAYASGVSAAQPTVQGQAIYGTTPGAVNGRFSRPLPGLQLVPNGAGGQRLR
jgi:hypothetical protein